MLCNECPIETCQQKHTSIFGRIKPPIKKTLLGGLRYYSLLAFWGKSVMWCHYNLLRPVDDTTVLSLVTIWWPETARSIKFAFLLTSKILEATQPTTVFFAFREGEVMLDDVDHRLFWRRFWDPLRAQEKKDNPCATLKTGKSGGV